MLYKIIIMELVVNESDGVGDASEHQTFVYNHIAMPVYRVMSNDKCIYLYIPLFPLSYSLSVLDKNLC